MFHRYTTLVQGLTSLVLPLLAQVHDDLGGSLVQGVEVVPVLHVEAAVGELVDAAEAVHQFTGRKVGQHKQVQNI